MSDSIKGFTEIEGDFNIRLFSEEVGNFPDLAGLLFGFFGLAVQRLPKFFIPTFPVPRFLLPRYISVPSTLNIAFI